MTEGVENLILEQLRLIRTEIGGLKSDLADFKTEVRSDFLTQKTMIYGLASVIGDFGQRVEHIELKLGIEQ
jgi:hypothetical protein